MAGEWMFMNPMLKPLALAWGRLELHGYRRVLNRVAGWDPIANAPHRRIKGKLHGYWMDLDLADWSERWTYFLGRYYEAHVQRLFQLALRPADSFVDIGANIGMTTLCAAALVTPAGRVVAFEPNPAVYKRLKGHIDANALQGFVDARNIGLADHPGVLTLAAPRHTGQATFAPPPPDEREGNFKDGVTLHQTPVRVGDDELAALPDAPTFIKIDVEGFEIKVLEGLARTIARLKPVIVTEALPDQLQRAGAAIEDLFRILQGHGYRAHALQYRPGLAGWPGALALLPVERYEPGLGNDLLWLIPGSVHEARLSAHIAPPPGPRA